MAAVLPGGAGAVLSHRSAAAHWGIRPSTRADAEVTRSADAALAAWPALPPFLIYLTMRSPSATGIPVTTVPRTLFDLAGVVSQRQLERAVNEAEIRRLWDPLSLPDLLERAPAPPGRRGDPGGDRGTRTQASHAAGSRSVFADFLDRWGLPRPATNVWLHVAGRWIEADCVWREQRLIVELDGHTLPWHEGRPSRSDRARDRALTAAGWRVIRITWRQLHRRAARHSPTTSVPPSPASALC